MKLLELLFTLISATQSCFELPDIITSCTRNNNSFSWFFDFSQTLILPEGSSCFIGSQDYGEFSGFTSHASIVNTT